jgi:hypothetical protein
VNLGLIEKFIAAGKLDAKAEITEDALVAAGLTSQARRHPRAGQGRDHLEAVTLTVTGASASAVEAVKRPAARSRFWHVTRRGRARRIRVVSGREGRLHHAEFSRAADRRTVRRRLA